MTDAIAFLLRRLAQAAGVLLAMSVLVFASVYAIGNPVDILISPQASQADRLAAIHALGLDRPLGAQYWSFLVHALQGDLGNSFMYNAPAIRLVLERMPATLELAVSAALIAVAVAIPLGLWAGTRPRALSSRVIMAGSLLGLSMPTFWVAVVLIMVFSVHLGWLPSGGRGPTIAVLGLQLSAFSAAGLRHLMLPALTLGLFKLSLLLRLTRAGTREALAQDYVRYARAKGLAERRIVGVHVLKNILPPVVTVAGIEFGSLIAFSIVTESIFAWPGMGKLLIDAIAVLDRPLIVAYLIVAVAVFTLINLVVDLLYFLLDPRVRARAGAQEAS
jgi:peptide/nickel transport system permease protein